MRDETRAIVEGLGKVAEYESAYAELVVTVGEEGAEEAALARVVGVGKRRGRPKGSRNKAKEEVPVESDGRRCSYEDGVEWVAANLFREDVREEDRPSDIAWGLLMWARSGGAAQQSFFTQVYAKLAPAKAEREYAAMQKEGLARDERLVEKVLRLARKAESEGRNSVPWL